MISKKLSILLLLALFAITVYSHDPWECSHDKQEHDEPELLDIEEDWNPEGNDHSGRTLASYSKFRTYGYYGRLSGASTKFKTYIEKDLMPPILDYFSAALKVKYPVSGKLKTSASSICGGSTPSVLKSGVNADFVLFVGYKASSDWVASSAACSLASGTKRPLMGKTTISTTYMKVTSDPVLHEKNMMCMLHEVVHTLGLAKTFYTLYLDSNGKKAKNTVITTKLDGYTTTILNVAPLTSRIRKYFGCSSIKGMYMENTGSSGTAGIHFERRQYPFEVMSSGLISQMQVSEFTLALLEGMGWYAPDYSYADPYHFGRGKGCSFLTGKCSATSFKEWCSTSSRSCTVPGRGGGSCRSDTRSDNCKFIHPTDSYDCGSSSAKNYARLPELQKFGRTAGSKCFEGTLASKKAGSQTTFCLNYKCSGSGTSTKLTLTLGSKSVVCTSAGKKSVSGYAGTVTCPDPKTYCATTGAKVCPRGCMGRGSCVSGVCKCKSGYKGVDCALRSSF